MSSRPSAWQLPPTHTDVGAELIASAQASHRARLASTRPLVASSLTTHSSSSPAAAHAPAHDFSHLVSRRKQTLMAADRAAQVEHDNLLLVGRLRTVLGRKQVDNVAPLTLLPRSLNRRARREKLEEVVRENEAIARRIEQARTRGAMPTSEQLRRQGMESERVIARHCAFPRQDPLAYRSFLAGECGGHRRIGSMPLIGGAATAWGHEDEEAKSDDASTPARLLVPTPPRRPTPSLQQRPSTAAPTRPPHAPPFPVHASPVAQEPLLLERRRPSTARFKPALRSNGQVDPAELARRVEAALALSSSQQQAPTAGRAVRPATARPARGGGARHAPSAPNAAPAGLLMPPSSPLFPFTPGGPGLLLLSGAFPTTTSGLVPGASPLLLFRGGAPIRAQSEGGQRVCQCEVWEKFVPVWGMEIRVTQEEEEGDGEAQGRGQGRRQGDEEAGGLEFMMDIPFATLWPVLAASASSTSTASSSSSSPLPAPPPLLDPSRRAELVQFILGSLRLVPSDGGGDGGDMELRLDFTESEGDDDEARRTTVVTISPPVRAADATEADGVAAAAPTPADASPPPDDARITQQQSAQSAHTQDVPAHEQASSLPSSIAAIPEQHQAQLMQLLQQAKSMQQHQPQPQQQPPPPTTTSRAKVTFIPRTHTVIHPRLHTSAAAAAAAAAVTAAATAATSTTLPTASTQSSHRVPVPAPSSSKIGELFVIPTRRGGALSLNFTPEQTQQAATIAAEAVAADTATVDENTHRLSPVPEPEPEPVPEAAPRPSALVVEDHEHRISVVDLSKLRDRGSPAPHEGAPTTPVMIQSPPVPLRLSLPSAPASPISIMSPPLSMRASPMAHKLQQHHAPPPSQGSRNRETARFSMLDPRLIYQIDRLRTDTPVVFATRHVQGRGQMQPPLAPGPASAHDQLLSASDDRTTPLPEFRDFDSSLISPRGPPLQQRWSKRRSFEVMPSPPMSSARLLHVGEGDEEDLHAEQEQYQHDRQLAERYGRDSLVLQEETEEQMGTPEPEQ